MNHLNRAATVKFFTVLCLAVPWVASAACQGSPVAASALEGKTVCVTKGNDRFQEYHQAGGDLIDYKLGPPRAGNVDPMKKVGTWRADGTNVIYNYGAGGIFTYSVFRSGNSSNYCLSGNGEEIRPSDVLVGQVPCPAPPGRAR